MARRRASPFPFVVSAAFFVLPFISSLRGEIHLAPPEVVILSIVLAVFIFATDESDRGNERRARKRVQGYGAAAERAALSIVVAEDRGSVSLAPSCQDG